MEVIHHGAVEGVTGSCHELRLDNGEAVLIDCGLFQGAEVSKQGASADKLQIEFPISHIKALIVTHCHIDHIGRIPYLLAAGFKGPIYCSEPSAVLLPLMLEDALKIGFTRNERLIRKTLNLLQSLIRPVAYKTWEKVIPGLDIKLQQAGHILGSAYVECRCDVDDHRKIVTFSGDLGAPYAPLLAAPKSPYRSDLLVLESTYGDRTHLHRKLRVQQLRKVLIRAIEDKGIIVVPAFSLGRTQELLYELEAILRHSPELSTLEVVLDSPLTGKITDLYKQLKPYWDKEALQRVLSGRNPMNFSQLYRISSHEEHRQTMEYLEKHRTPVLVIAASGMCSGGRVVNYLKTFLPRRETDLLFIGYQAKGTPGAEIQKYASRNGYVVLDGEKIDIKADVHSLSGYSAHADQKDLINFVKRMRYKPTEIRLVHGSEFAKKALKQCLEIENPDIKVVIP